MTNSIEKKIISILKNVNEDKNKEKIKEIHIEQKIADIGINSITFVKLVVQIETEFDIEFDDENMDFSIFETVKQLIDYVNSKIEKSN